MMIILLPMTRRSVRFEGSNQEGKRGVEPMKTLLRSFRFAPLAAAALGFAPVGGVALLLISGFLALAPFPLQAQAQPGGATGSPGTRAWTDSRGETHAVSEKVARLLDDPGVWWG